MLEIVVLAKNASENLKKSLPYLKFADSLLVIDDYSTDDSAKIAVKFGARVIKRHLAGDFARARNFALSHTKADWVLFVDPDEIIPPKLQTEIKQIVSDNRRGSYYLRRLDFFKSLPLHHGDTGNTYLLRLQSRPFTPWTGMVHEIWTPTTPSYQLKNIFFHYPHPSIYSFLHKLNNYSEIRSAELYTLGHSTNLFEIIFYPIFKFIYLYLFKLGILDGNIGFIHAMLMSFYTFLVRGKLYLLQKQSSSKIKSDHRF